MQLPALQVARLHVLTTLTDTIEVIGPGDTVDDAYGSSSSPGEVESTVPGRVARLSGREAQDAARIASDATWVITLPYGTQVTSRHTLRSLETGTTYGISAVNTSTTAITIRCLCTGGDA